MHVLRFDGRVRLKWISCHTVRLSWYYRETKHGMEVHDIDAEDARLRRLSSSIPDPPGKMSVSSHAVATDYVPEAARTGSWLIFENC